MGIFGGRRSRRSTQPEITWVPDGSGVTRLGDWSRTGRGRFDAPGSAYAVAFLSEQLPEAMIRLTFAPFPGLDGEYGVVMHTEHLIMDVASEFDAVIVCPPRNCWPMGPDQDVADAAWRALHGEPPWWDGVIHARTTGA